MTHAAGRPRMNSYLREAVVLASNGGMRIFSIADIAVAMEEVLRARKADSTKSVFHGARLPRSVRAVRSYFVAYRKLLGVEKAETIDKRVYWRLKP